MSQSTDLDLQSQFQFQTIGIVHSCFKEKFGTPRQPGLVPAAIAELELLPPYNRIESLEGIEGFSHLWIQFVFHQCLREHLHSKKWKPMVKPPRLGGKEKVGVFASRSTFRPNPIGLSVVELIAVNHDRESGKLVLQIRGADLIDGTPVLDIKPYLTYADRIDNARSGFAPAAPNKISVQFSAEAEQFCQQYYTAQGYDLRELVQQVLEIDPRPAYYKDRVADRLYGITLRDCEVKWGYNEALNKIEVCYLLPI